MGEKSSSFGSPNPLWLEGKWSHRSSRRTHLRSGRSDISPGWGGLAASAQAGTLTCGRKPGRWQGPRSIWDRSAGSVEPEGSGGEVWRLRVPAGEVSWPGKVQLCAAIPGMSGRRQKGRRLPRAWVRGGGQRREGCGLGRISPPRLLTREVAARTLARGKDGSWDRPVGGGPGRGYCRGR